MKTIFKNTLLVTLLLLLAASTSFAQRKRQLSSEETNIVDNALLLHISYAFQTPGGDMAKLFGNSFDVGLGLEWLTAKGNWILGIDGGYLFGSNVKFDVLANLRTPEGFIIGNDRTYADVQMRERGFHSSLVVGKLFPISSVNKRSGIRFTVSGGFLQHKIRIQEDPSREVPQVSGEYKKGYDRLTNGLLIGQFIGYQHLAANRQANFFAGFEFMQGFTQNRRDFNFDSRSKDDSKRLDLLFGIRLGWTLPFYMNPNPESIYYY